MRFMRFFLTAAVLFSCFLHPLAAKPADIKGIPKDCKVHKPGYTQDYLNEELLNTFIAKGYEYPEKTNQYWDVYSDRKHNVTYVNNSATSAPYSELGFREKVRIARIRKGFALVYKVKDQPSVYPQIPADVEWKGWVPMTNLVFMEKVMVNDFGVPVSVLVNDNVGFDSRLKLNAGLYYTPAGEAEKIDLPSRSNSLFYTVKVDGQFILLATDTEISDASQIYGWMKWEDVMLWKTRIALEPTWDIMDNESLSRSGHTCVIKGMNDEPIGSVDFVQRQGGGIFSSEYHRLHSGAWRYPVINSNASYSLCAIPGQSSYLDNPSQRVPVIAGEENADESFYLVQEAQGADINIMFVMDGSRLYEPFFPILAERIPLIGNQGGPSHIKVGALIYHDSRSGEHMTELQELTRPDDPALYEFIDMGGLYGFKDNLSEAPLLAALDEVMNNAGFDPLAQNFIILIGGRGDSSDSSLIPSEIAERLASTNVGMYALQVQNNSRTAAYRLFGYLMEDILRQSVERKQESAVSSQSETGAEYTSISYYADNGNSTEIFDGYQSVNSGMMSEEDFEANLELILQRINRSVDSSVDHSANLSSMYPQFFRSGVIENKWNGREQFKQVALYSSSDFDRILGLLSRLNEMYLISNTNREQFFSLLMEYLPPFVKMENIYYPYDKDDVQALVAGLKKMGLYQLFSFIEGIDSSNTYAGHSLKDILSPKDVSDQEFLYILSDISRRFYRLLTIRNNPALYSTYINNQSYFWIPCDDLL